ncbi:MAG: right-handed parallel beta-helix repeat-containing protein [Chitinophagales bacterium]|nr:right-handed parallel beta-helix repeat-containing protein [Chitinophagales bacterium]MCZ2394066.1 right-handed parallel beta-helix repeat-containing protein [Chitinophagales bacterium]
MKSTFFYILIIVVVNFSACKPKAGKDLLVSDDFQNAIQERLVNAQDGEIIELPEGNFQLTQTLFIEGVNNVTIKGQGIDKTFLSFKNQEEGSEGFNISNVKNFSMSDFTIEDAKGDNIKIKSADGLVLKNINSRWTDGAKESNGAYGLYPVESKDVLVEDCEVSYASDAGIYVGQSVNVVVRRCYTHHNVAGIEIENCINSDVYENRTINNTGGILVFDLPDLPLSNGRNSRIFNNEIQENNHKNFAPKGNIVATVPPGTGIIVLATDSVDIFNNKIINQKSVGIAIASYQLLQKPYNDSTYGPYSSAISIRDNQISTNKLIVDMSTDLGKLLFAVYRLPMDIIYDGIADPNLLDDNGILKDGHQICIRNNGDQIKFGNLNAAKIDNLKDILKYSSTDITPFDCSFKGITGKKTPIQ